MKSIYDTKIYLIFLIFIICSLSSCNILKNNETDYNVKQSLNEVNTRIDYLLTLKLPATEMKLIKNLKKEMRLFLYKKPNTVPEIATNLARLIPEEDFRILFYTNDNYNYNGNYQGKTAVSDEIINDLKLLNNRIDIINNVDRKLLKCNCRWFCCIGCGGTPCEKTENGCGWFLRQPCTDA